MDWNFITFMIVWAVVVVMVWRGIWRATRDDREEMRKDRW
jgi:hypothetical protein